MLLIAGMPFCEIGLNAVIDHAHLFLIHLQIMLYVGSCFAYLIVCLYGIYLKITDKSISADMVSLEALWALYYIGCVMMIIAVASLTTREVH